MTNTVAMYNFYESQSIVLMRKITIRLGRTKIIAATTTLSIVMSVVATVGNLYVFGFLDADYVTLVSILIAVVIPFSVALPVSWFTVSMVFSLHQLEAETRLLATYDSMTGLLNRRAFLEEANRVWQDALPRNVNFSLLILDVDHFKQINDTHGHAMGDRVLEAFGKIVHNNLRTGVLAGRIGGEEFAFLLPDRTGEEGWHFAEQLHQSIRQTVIAENGVSVRFAVSIGLVFCAQIATVEKAMSLADKALYRAKKNGRNQSVLYPARAQSNPSAPQFDLDNVTTASDLVVHDSSAAVAVIVN